MKEQKKVLTTLCCPYYDKQIMLLTLGVVEFSVTLQLGKRWIITLHELELPKWHDFGIIFSEQPCVDVNGLVFVRAAEVL